MPPPQLNDEPFALDEAVKASLVLTQVNVAGAAMVATGAVVFWITVADAVLVQPLAGSVIVTI